MDRLKAIYKLNTFCREQDCDMCPLADDEGDCKHQKPFDEYTEQELEESLKIIEEAEL